MLKKFKDIFKTKYSIISQAAFRLEESDFLGLTFSSKHN